MPGLYDGPNNESDCNGHSESGSQQPARFFRLRGAIYPGAICNYCDGDQSHSAGHSHPRRRQHCGAEKEQTHAQNEGDLKWLHLF